MNQSSLTTNKYFVSWSGGKDCSFALYLFLKEHPEAKLHLLHMKRVHGRRAHRFTERLLDAQAEAMGLPLTRVLVDPPEQYAQFFQEALADMKAQGMDHGIFGDIYLETHRVWIDEQCAKAGITPIYPLWGMTVQDIYQQVVEAGFKSLIITVQKAYKPLLGRFLTAELVDETAAYEGFDICGELGEYHSLMVDGPTFKHPLQYRVVSQFENEKLFGNELDIPTVDVTLIRHGQTVENTQNRCQGHTVGTLSSLGIEQAEQLSAELIDEQFDCVFSSDLSRAKITAEMIFPQAQIIEDARLRERFYGDLEGEVLPANLRFDEEIDGAETLLSLKERVQDFLTMLHRDYAGQKIAIVSHGIVIKTMLSLCSEDDFSEIRIPKNCSPYRIEL